MEFYILFPFDQVGNLATGDFGKISAELPMDYNAWNPCRADFSPLQAMLLYE